MPDMSVAEEALHWQRQLERDRLSMLAMRQGENFPGPGAAAKEDEEEEKNKALIADVEKKIAPMASVLQTRLLLWGTVVAASASVAAMFIAIGALVALHIHKFFTDQQLKSAAQAAGTAMRQVPNGAIPHARFARLVLNFAGGLLLAEWIVIGVLDMLLLAIAGGLIGVASVIMWCYQNTTECGWTVIAGA